MTPSIEDPPMIRITWQGLDHPPVTVSETLRQRLTTFILQKVESILPEIKEENGYFDITDADDPAQLSITPKEFSPGLTKKILSQFAA